MRERLTSGLVIAVEPIVSAGSGAATGDPDGRTVRTAEGSQSAHVEHTIVITERRPILIAA